MRLFDIYKKTHITIHLKQEFDGSLYDAPEEGLIKIFKVILHSDQPIATTTIMVSSTTKLGRINDTEVIKNKRGQGFATILYQKILEKANEFNVIAFLSDTDKKPQIKHIWEKLGGYKFEAPEGIVYRIDV